MIVAFSIFIFSFFIQLVYYAVFYRSLRKYIPKKPLSEKPLSVSVIICAKNESDHLKRFLPEIYTQDYPHFEVVLIDDRSSDDTWEVMDSFKEKYPLKTRVVRVDFTENPTFVGNKKYALTLGIKAAKYEHLLFTDADCRPVSKNWIKGMSAHFDQKKELILGYGKYFTTPGLLNKLIRFETLQTAMQYFSYALSGVPYMGVGRNLAYTKNLFFENNGFYNHIKILSGDDDLFVNSVSNNINTAVCMEPDTFTISKPKKTWKEWIYQKRRHISTSNHYKWKHKLLLGLYSLSLILFYISASFLLLIGYRWKLVLALVILRFFWVVFVQKKWAEKLKEKEMISYFLLLEPFLILMQVYIFILNLFHKPQTWKN
jgi:glycosyltransferase involved in cell wall biosynthesis